MVEREQHAAKTAIGGARGRFSAELLLRTRFARFVHVGGLFSGDHKIKTWSRLLRSVTEYPPHFLRLAPRLGLVSSERHKEAVIVTGVVLAILGTLTLGAASVAQFNKFRIEIAGLKRDLGGMREKLAKLEANPVASPHSKEMKHDVEDRTVNTVGPPPTAPFALTRDEIQLIRDFIKVPPPLPGAAQNISVGDLLPAAALAPLPEPIMDRVPKLRGARFTVDRNSAIVVVAPGANRADVIINPS
jgi:hypothetical protein